MKLNRIILTWAALFTVTNAPLTTLSQSCSGHWANNHPLTFQCIAGQQIGLPPMGDPVGCPINPNYTSSQSNTFYFDSPVDDFFIDFNAFNSLAIGCPRMRININSIFYPISSMNLVELPLGTSCTGSLTFLTITNDGYITTAFSQSNGQGRLVFTGVNASSITISTNDAGGGIVVANPCFAPLPIQIKYFTGFASRNCEIKLEFESGIESNLRNIEIEGSLEGIHFTKLIETLPKGSDSRYIVHLNALKNSFFRLKINDLDGKFYYSEIIRVINNCSLSKLRIFPNPATNKILVENLQRNDQIIIVDVTGREVFSQLVTNSSTEINIQHLASGIYSIKLFRPSAYLESVKFIKL
jgi:hypothetical protein